MDYYFNDGSRLVPANTSTLYKGKHDCTNNARREENCKLVNVCIVNFQLFCYLKTYEATKITKCWVFTSKPNTIHAADNKNTKNCLWKQKQGRRKETKNGTTEIQLEATKVLRASNTQLLHSLFSVLNFMAPSDHWTYCNNKNNINNGLRGGNRTVMPEILTSSDICQKCDFLRLTANPLSNSLIAFAFYFSSYSGVKVTIK